jgi:uncharacterized DUF497 family protein
MRSPRVYNRYVRFEWDARKERENLRKHGVSFREASSVFFDTLSVTGEDPDHSVDERRWVIFGLSSAGRLLVVSYVERQGTIRIISSRVMNPGERHIYEEG